jgi:hypothetical protein
MLKPSVCIVATRLLKLITLPGKVIKITQNSQLELTPSPLNKAVTQKEINAIPNALLIKHRQTLSKTRNRFSVTTFPQNKYPSFVNRNKYLTVKSLCLMGWLRTAMVYKLPAERTDTSHETTSDVFASISLNSPLGCSLLLHFVQELIRLLSHTVPGFPSTPLLPPPTITIAGTLRSRNKRVDVTLLCLIYSSQASAPYEDEPNNNQVRWGLAYPYVINR